MLRPRTIVVAVVLLLVLGVAALLAALPTIVRSMAVDRIAKLTGRGTTLERVEINLFTGRVALRGFRLAQRASSDPALELSGLEVRVSRSEERRVGKECRL